MLTDVQKAATNADEPTLEEIDIYERLLDELGHVLPTVFRGYTYAAPKHLYAVKAPGSGRPMSPNFASIRALEPGTYTILFGMTKKNVNSVNYYHQRPDLHERGLAVARYPGDDPSLGCVIFRYRKEDQPRSFTIEEREAKREAATALPGWIKQEEARDDIPPPRGFRETTIEELEDNLTRLQAGQSIHVATGGNITAMQRSALLIMFSRLGEGYTHEPTTRGYRIWRLK